MAEDRRIAIHPCWKALSLNAHRDRSPSSGSIFDYRIEMMACCSGSKRQRPMLVRLRCSVQRCAQRLKAGYPRSHCAQTKLVFPGQFAQLQLVTTRPARDSSCNCMLKLSINIRMRLGKPFHHTAHAFKATRGRMIARKRARIHQQMTHLVALVLGIVAGCDLLMSSAGAAAREGRQQIIEPH